MLCALGAWRHDLLAGGEEGPEVSRARDEAGAALAAALGRLMVLGQLAPGRAVPESEALEVRMVHVEGWGWHWRWVEGTAWFFLSGAGVTLDVLGCILHWTPAPRPVHLGSPSPGLAISKIPFPTSTYSILLPQALISVLGLAFDPATEAAPQFRQTLTVALETLASLSLQAQSLLASALLPAARRWDGFGGLGGCSRAPGNSSRCVPAPCATVLKA